MAAHNLVKLAAQCTGMPEFVARQKPLRQWAVAQGHGDVAVITTRTAPRRHREIVAAGGSVFWVFQGAIQCRQQIRDIQAVRGDRLCPLADGTGRPERVAILLDPVPVLVRPTPKKPFQGWRYLENPPSDIGLWSAHGHGGDDAADMPRAMREELSRLGVL